MTPGRQDRRRYDATRRQAQARENRARIVAAASRLFVEKGYAATSVAQVAEAAGVSAPTVFAHFTSKVNLLKTAVDISIVGDDEEVPLHERPAMRRMHEAPTAAEALRQFALAATEISDRAFPLFAVLEHAVDADPEIAHLAHELESQRLTGTGYVAATVADRLGVSGDPAAIERIRDTIWTTFSPQVHDLLVIKRGWSPEAYRTWVVSAALAAIEATLVVPGPGPGAGPSP